MTVCYEPLEDLKQFARQHRFWLSVPGSRWIRTFNVTDVSYTKTEPIELEPCVAKPIQLGECIELMDSSAFCLDEAGVFVLLCDYIFPE